MQASSPEARPSQDWKARYTDLVNEFDRAEEQHKEQIDGWCKAVSRLTTSLTDLAPTVTEQAQSLLQLASRQENGEQAAQQSTDLCRQLADLPSPGSAVDQNGTQMAEYREQLAKMCGLLGLGVEHQVDIIGTDEDSFPGMEQALKNLAKVLAQPTTTVTGDQEIKELTKGLIAIVDGLPIFPETRQTANSLGSRLRECDAIASLNPLVAELAELVGITHQELATEREQTTQFLSGMWQRLKELGDYFAEADTNHKSCVAASSDLERNIHYQVDAIISKANSADSLPALQALIQNSVDQIRHQVTDHLQHEQQRLIETENQCRSLASEVSALQQESTDLRKALEAQQNEANRDPLTRLANRRLFDQALAQEHQRWKRYQRPLSIAFLDIDHFKRINDDYGHQAGDVALKSVAKILRKSMRDADLLARYGGEEFVALMPDTDQTQATDAVEKLRCAVMGTRFHFNDLDVQITISCGVAEFSGDLRPQEVLERADQALYQAKNNGRNQTVSAEQAAQ